MDLSDNFTLEEMTRSDWARRHGIYNTPSEAQIENLTRVCVQVLEPPRMRYGTPFRPSSGYRSWRVNIGVGGQPESMHVLGCAVDFDIPGVDNRDLAEWVAQNCWYRTVILEHYVPGVPTSGWVHVDIYPDPDNEDREPRAWWYHGGEYEELL